MTISVTSGQTLNISSGQTSSGITVLSSGTVNVQSGGVATGTFVSGIGGASATEVISAGGVASNTSVGSGGRILVSAGTAVSAVISSGATETVFSGGTLNGATIDGGSVEIKSGGGVTSGSLITISSGTLILDQAQNFSGTVAGLATSGAQNIDLVNVSSASLQPLSYTDSGGSGTLTVTDGTTTVQLHLIGTYTVGSFKTSVDGTGGTIITDPPVSSGVALALTS